jgi:hypothetical protein
MRVHILGKGDGWETIKDVPEGEIIYGVNDSFLRTPAVTHTFHMHDMEEYLERKETNSSTRLCIVHANKNPKMKFISIYKWDKVENSEEYPLEEIVNKFNVCYFTSTIDYMIAYALHHGAKEIIFHGVNMTQKEEYVSQKPGAEFWIGYALGMGVKVKLQYEHTSLLKTKIWNGREFEYEKIYGYFIPQFKPEGQ